MLPKAEALARRIAENGPLAVRRIKETVVRGSGLTLQEGYAIEDESRRVVLASEDAKEGPARVHRKTAAALRGTIIGDLRAMEPISLEGKVAVVTGSGRGLGLAFAQALGKAGAAVVINDIDEAVAKAAVDAITAAGGSAVAEVVPVGQHGGEPSGWSRARSTASAASTSCAPTPASCAIACCGT